MEQHDTINKVWNDIFKEAEKKERQDKYKIYMISFGTFILGIICGKFNII